jgi:anti-sigma factor RsiW
MNCDQIQELIHTYLDAELDLARSLEIEQHLEGCPACATSLNRFRALGSALRQTQVHTAPARLRSRVIAGIRAEAPRRRMPRAGWIGLAATILIAAGVVWQMIPRSIPDVVADQIIASHVRSLLADHLTDVASSDRHTVKPWFNGKLDFSPVVMDPASDGFPLVGGRLDYLDDRPVAALVYRKQRHVINVLVWPDDSRLTLRPVDRRGYHLIPWRRDGLFWCAVSDVDPAALQRLAELLQQPPAQSPMGEPPSTTARD